MALIRGWKTNMGVRLRETLTVGEMINELKRFPDDMPVLYTWESITREVKRSDFSEDVYGEQLVLFIDCE